jgi:phage regulator Rha-like protein
MYFINILSPICYGLGMNKTNNGKSLVPEERIEQTILIIRNQKVILDSDLAALYGVETKNLNKAIRRNKDRFPEDFVFQLTGDEVESLRFQIGTSNLRSQFVTANPGSGGRRYLPYAFTEHGALMAANVLNSERAAAMSVAIIRTFVKLRQMLSINKDLSHRLDELEQKYDEQFQIVFEVIRRLTESPEEPKKPIIGFHG